MISLTIGQLSIITIVLALIVIALLVTVIILWNKLKKFLVGIDSDHIGNSLTHVSGELNSLQMFRKEIEDYLTTVEKRLRKSVQSVHTVRYNPFKGTGGGGNQSFATAFLTEEGDGVIVSSLYSREHVSIFAKPIKKLVAEHELSEEENEALENAKTRLK